jgi:hypothetical protein
VVVEGPVLMGSRASEEGSAHRAPREWAGFRRWGMGGMEEDGMHDAGRRPVRPPAIFWPPAIFCIMMAFMMQAR